MATVTWDVRRLGRGVWRKHKDAEAGFNDLEARLRKIADPYRQRVAADDWGPERDLHETMHRVRTHIAGDPGSRVILRGARDDQPRFAIRKSIVLEGPAIVRVALAQLGDNYTWAAEGPDQFDCSGFTAYCYDHGAGVYLPHSAYQQAHEAIDVLFHDADKLMPGDLIFCDASSRPAPNHVGIYAGVHDGERKIIDASSTADQIVYRRYDSNPIWGLGRVTSVNGPLG